MCSQIYSNIIQVFTFFYESHFFPGQTSVPPRSGTCIPDLSHDPIWAIWLVEVRKFHQHHDRIKNTSKLYSSCHGEREMYRWPLDFLHNLPDNTEFVIYLNNLRNSHHVLYILHVLSSSISIFILTSGSNALILALSFQIFSSSINHLWNIWSRNLPYSLRYTWSMI